MTNLTDLFPAVPTYTPAMMQFDGSTGYYSNTFTSAGNKVTGIIRFSRDSFATASGEYLFNSRKTNGRLQVVVWASNHANANYQDRVGMLVQNSVGATICFLISPTGYMDGEAHTLFCSFDGDAGVATFYIDGANADDAGNAARVAPTTGTLSSGVTTDITVGNLGASNYFAGNAGFFGHSDSYLTNWSDFFYTDDSPRQLDTIGWTQWNAGTFQTPMMTFDGSTGYYTKTQATSGNKVTLVARFNLIENPSGTGAQYVVRSSGNTTDSRAAIILSDGNHATPAVRNTINFLAWNSAGAIICRLFSTEGVNMADTLVTVFASFDGDTGTGVMRVNGVSEDATHSSRVAPTTGTMDTGSATQSVGANWDGSLSSNGNIGFVGMRDAYLTNWSDFMEANGSPKALDESTWTEWGAQPLFWNEHGDMVNNLGSAGALTKNGTINVGKGGNYV